MNNPDPKKAIITLADDREIIIATHNGTSIVTAWDGIDRDEVLNIISSLAFYLAENPPADSLEK